MAVRMEVNEPCPRSHGGLITAALIGRPVHRWEAFLVPRFIHETLPTRVVFASADFPAVLTVR